MTFQFFRTLCSLLTLLMHESSSKTLKSLICFLKNASVQYSYFIRELWDEKCKKTINTALARATYMREFSTFHHPLTDGRWSQNMVWIGEFFQDSNTR